MTADAEMLNHEVVNETRMKLLEIADKANLFSVCALNSNVQAKRTCGSGMFIFFWVASLLPLQARRPRSVRFLVSCPQDLVAVRTHVNELWFA